MSPEDQTKTIAALAAFQKEIHVNAVSKGWWDVQADGLAASRVLSRRIRECEEKGDHEGAAEASLAMSFVTRRSVKSLSESISLLHSEASEALESTRKGHPASVKIPGFTNTEEEYADVLIRLLDDAAGHGLRVIEAAIAKHEYNKTRPYLHGGKKF